jgi:hypothetical protein
MSAALVMYGLLIWLILSPYGFAFDLNFIYHSLSGESFGV